MEKSDRKEALKLIDEGMIFSQELIFKAKTSEERLIGQSLFNSYYTLKLLYKEVK